jgi:hypothetical protein
MVVVRQVVCVCAWIVDGVEVNETETERFHREVVWVCPTHEQAHDTTETFSLLRSISCNNNHLQMNMYLGKTLKNKGMHHYTAHSVK